MEPSLVPKATSLELNMMRAAADTRWNHGFGILTGRMLKFTADSQDKYAQKVANDVFNKFKDGAFLHAKTELYHDNDYTDAMKKFKEAIGSINHMNEREKVAFAAILNRKNEINPELVESINKLFEAEQKDGKRVKLIAHKVLHEQGNEADKKRISTDKPLDAYGAFKQHVNNWRILALTMSTTLDEMKKGAYDKKYGKLLEIINSYQNNARLSTSIIEASEKIPNIKGLYNLANKAYGFTDVFYGDATPTPQLAAIAEKYHAELTEATPGDRSYARLSNDLFFLMLEAKHDKISTNEEKSAFNSQINEMCETGWFSSEELKKLRNFKFVDVPEIMPKAPAPIEIEEMNLDQLKEHDAIERSVLMSMLEEPIKEAFPLGTYDRSFNIELLFAHLENAIIKNDVKLFSNYLGISETVKNQIEKLGKIYAQKAIKVEQIEDVTQKATELDEAARKKQTVEKAVSIADDYEIEKTPEAVSKTKPVREKKKIKKSSLKANEKILAQSNYWSSVKPRVPKERT